MGSNANVCFGRLSRDFAASRRHLVGSTGWAETESLGADRHQRRVQAQQPQSHQRQTHTQTKRPTLAATRTVIIVLQLIDLFLQPWEAKITADIKNCH